MTTHYDPSDGDWNRGQFADYGKLLDDAQAEQGIDIGAYLEICVQLEDDQLYIVCSNSEGNEWEYSYTWPIPASWDVENVRDMFGGNVYMQTDDYQAEEDDEEEEDE